MPVLDRRKLLIATAVVLAANGIDLATTYIVSPDLANEWNVLQRVYGLGWAGLIVAKLLGGLLAVAGYAYYLRYRASCYPPSGASYGEFCRYFAFGKPVSWLQMQYRMPALRHLGVNLGYFWTGMQALVFWVALDNILLSRGFAWGIRAYSESAYHVLQSFAVAAVVLTRFYWGNYRRYRAQSAFAVVRAVEPAPVAQTVGTI